MAINETLHMLPVDENTHTIVDSMIIEQDIYPDTGIITKRNFNSYGQVEAVQILNEVHTIMRNRIILNQIPSTYYRVQINGMTENVNGTQANLTANQFTVVYDSGIIYFNSAMEGQQITINQYYGIGIEMIPTSRIYIGTDSDGNITNTLYDMIKVGTNAITALEEVGGVLADGKATAERLERDNTTATNTDATLNTAITNANTINTTLNSTITTANTSNTTLNDTITKAKPVQANLDASINNGQSLDFTINKNINTLQTLYTNLTNDISTGDTLHSNLTNDISNSTSLNSELSKTITEATNINTSLETTLTNATNTQQTLSTAITNGTNISNTIGNDIKTLTTLSNNLNNDISTGNTLHTNLANDITNGTSLNTSLSNTVNTATSVEKSLSKDIEDYKGISKGSLNEASTPVLSGNWSMEDGVFFSFLRKSTTTNNTTENPVVSMGTVNNIFTIQHGTNSTSKPLVTYAPINETDVTTPIDVKVPLEVSSGSSGNSIRLDNGSVKVNDARVLYIDSKNNVWINSSDTMTNGKGLAYTYISGNLNLDVVKTIESGYQIAGNNVLTTNNNMININEAKAYDTLNLNANTINFNGSATSNGSQMYTLKGVMATNTDLDNLTATGIYYCDSFSVASSLINCPNNVQGMLEVWNVGGAGVTEADTSFIMQRYTTVMNKPEVSAHNIAGVYIRSYDKGSNDWSYWQPIYAYDYSTNSTYYEFNQSYNPAPNTYPVNAYNTSATTHSTTYIALPAMVATLGKETTNLLLNQQQQKQQIEETGKKTTELVLTSMKTQEQNSSLGKLIPNIILNGSKVGSDVKTLISQTQSLGKNLTGGIIDNIKIKAQNSELGNIVSNLELENAQLKEQNTLLKQQIKALAEIMIKQTLGGK